MCVVERNFFFFKVGGVSGLFEDELWIDGLRNCWKVDST